MSSLKPTNTWQEVVDRLAVIERKRISIQRAQQICERAMEKLRLALMEDPLVKECLEGTKDAPTRRV